MAHYSGKNLKVYFISTVNDLSGTARAVDITETAPAPAAIDVTHKDDTARQIVPGLSGAPETNMTLQVLEDSVWAAMLSTLTLNTSGNVMVLPRGATHTYEQILITLAVLHERKTAVPFDNAVLLDTTWNSKSTVTRSTWSSATTTF